MTRATGVGSHPGDDQQAFDDAVRIVLSDLPELTYVPEVPGRGAPAGMIGRTLALLDGLGVDLQPAGWRITDASGIDHRRAVSLLSQDLDTFEEHSQGFDGIVKVQVTGPWTLAASVERPRGDKVLADHGLRRELAQSLAAGLVDHVAGLRRRVPGARILVQVDEPSLPSVLTGGVPTASGFSRHRTVDAAGAAPALEWVLSAAQTAGAEAVVHCCADSVPFDLLSRVGADGIGVDLDHLDAQGCDQVAQVVDRADWVFLGVLPSLRPDSVPTLGSVVERVERLFDMIGLQPTDKVVLTPACGLAGADPGWVRTALGLCRDAAAQLT